MPLDFLETHIYIFKQGGIVITVLRSTVLALTLCVAGTALAQDASNPIRIGVIGPFSGGSSPMGQSMLHAVRLATAEQNWKGGLFGRKIVLVERDDQAKPDVGEAAAKDLVEKQKVDAVVGIANTGVGLVAIKHFQNARIPMIINMAAGAPLTQTYSPPKVPDSYIFRLAANDGIQTARLVMEGVDRLKLTRFAVLGDNTPYGRSGVENLNKALDARGLKAVFEGSFDVGQTDMKALISQARASGAQAILAWGIGPELAALAKDRARAGWNVPLLGGWTLSLDNFIQAAGKAGDGALMTQTFIAEPITLRRQEFLFAYRKESKLDKIPSAVSAAQGYDSMLLMFAAMRQANSTNGTSVRNALENLRLPVMGVVTTYLKPYSHADHEAVTGDMVVTGAVRNGRVTFAHQEEVKDIILGRRQGPAKTIKTAL